LQTHRFSRVWLPLLLDQSHKPQPQGTLLRNGTPVKNKVLKRVF